MRANSLSKIQFWFNIWAVNLKGNSIENWFCVKKDSSEKIALPGLYFHQIYSPKNTYSKNKHCQSKREIFFYHL